MMIAQDKSSTNSQATFHVVFIGPSRPLTLDLVDFLRSPPPIVTEAWRESVKALHVVSDKQELEQTTIKYKVDLINHGVGEADSSAVLEELSNLSLSKKTIIILEPMDRPDKNPLSRTSSLIHQIRSQINNPIIVLTDINVEDRPAILVKAAAGILSIGADRFISIHEDNRVIEAYIRALVPSDDYSSAAQTTVDLPPYRAILNDRNKMERFVIVSPEGREHQIALTPAENRILETLIVNQGRPVLKPSLLAPKRLTSEPIGDVDVKVVESQMCKLRKKLDNYFTSLYGDGYIQLAEPLITTVRNGYKIDPTYNGLRPQSGLLEPSLLAKTF